MIKLYRELESPPADAIEAEFREMVLAYDRVVLAAGEAERLFGSGVSAPVLTDNARTVSGAEEIASYLNEVRKLVHDWQLFQGDYCYVDDDGETC